MSSQQLDEERIFQVARKLPDAESLAEYLDQICGGDAALRERVEALLKVQDDEKDFLKSGSPSQEATIDHKPTLERAGATIGRYKLMEQIGEGGMGTVFVAQQDRPIRRKVALKVIKPGMDSRAIVARFEAERQALAMMDHPNIAKVLDAGTADSGRPYFAMELVKGVPITEYCDKNKLTVRERLELFIQVCQAIQHAHQKGIIHRDIKPGNVLVTLHDGKPVPKVIDFGVAKAISAQLTDKTVYTEHLQIVGTLLYMSPEQAELSGLGVDTRSDIYSLGVLLYELLTGTTPFRKEDLDKAGFDEQRKIIREQEPPRVSARISSLGEAVTATAEHRMTDAKKLNQLVQGDLDCITLTALDKDRTRRYETANGLANDIRRYLDDEPVGARPPSTMYLATRFVRRNRVMVGVAISLATIVIVASVISTLGWLSATRRLASLREMVIERAIQQAVAGELEQLSVTIEKAEQIGVPQDWILTLRGVYHIHQVENDQAAKLLEDARKLNPKNVSAVAMLSLAYYHNGDWGKWAVLAEEVKELKPRVEYEEFDTLFLGYGWFYVDYATAAEKLKTVLDGHPSWYVPRALLAAAYAHRSRSEEGTESVEQGISEVQAPLHLSGENPFVILCCLYVHMTAIERLEGSHPELERVASELAGKLDRYHKYPVGSLVRAQYYESQDNDTKAIQAWKDVLKHGRGVIRLWPAATLSAVGAVNADTDFEPRDLAGDIARGYVYALSDDPTSHEKALKIFHDLKDDCDTWIMRHTLIQIPLLLGDQKAARRQCEAWLAKTDRGGIDNDTWLERESIEFLADHAKLDVNSSNPAEQWFAHYQQGFLAIADRNWTKATEHFSFCNLHRYYRRAAFRRFWARTLEDHAKKSQEIRLQK